MNISVNPLTFVISIAKADLTLIQSTTSEIRQMNLNDFRLALKDWEDDVEGIPMLKTHDHYPEVSVGGVTLARVIILLEPYTVTFEDGQYAVNLVGANSNVGDRVNVNQVSIRTANSAGMISSADIEYASYQNGVAIDVTSPYLGTLHPTGTRRQPVNNLADALLIANYRGLTTLYILSSMTLNSGSNLTAFKVIGESHAETVLDIAPSAITNKITIQNAFIEGTLDGDTHISRCSVGTINYVNGHIHDCGLFGTIYLDGNENAIIANCFTIDPRSPPIIDMGNSGQDLAMSNYSGVVTIQNMTGANYINIGLNSGIVILDSNTVTGGIVHIAGIGRVEDELGNLLIFGHYTWNGGVTLINTVLSMENVSIAVWDELIANHTLPGTAGETLRLSAFQGSVWYDAINGTAGTTFPIGTVISPVNNFTDLLQIGADIGIRSFKIKGALVISADIEGYIFEGIGDMITDTIVLSGQSISSSSFKQLTVTGTMTGSGNWNTCFLIALSGLNGVGDGVGMVGPIVMGPEGSAFHGKDIQPAEQPTIIDMVGANRLFQVQGIGVAQFNNMTAGSIIVIGGEFGSITLDSTCTGGLVLVSGGFIVIDNSGGAVTIIDQTVDGRHGAGSWEGDTAANIADAVWDAVTDDHSTSGTFGEKIGKKLLTFTKWIGLK